MIYIIDERALEGKPVDMDARLVAWFEKQIGAKKPLWPGKPKDWLAPWPPFNNAETRSYHARLSAWYRLTLKYPSSLFIEELLKEGFKEHELYKGE